MAQRPLGSLSVVVLFLALSSVIELSAGSTNGGLYKPAGAEGSVHVDECPDKCQQRCSAAPAKRLCDVLCNYCCARCLCVPSGTSGNKKECRCYRSIKICP